MSYKPILIVCGEPNSVFSELLVKSLKNHKSGKPIILVGSSNLIKLQLKKLGLRLKLNPIDFSSKHLENIKKNQINILDVKYNFRL